VIAALARILNYLPKDHPQREYYAKMYKEIAAKLLRLQMENGMWTVNLLDPNELYLGESSGTGFFGYALAWGINNNILDKKTYAEPVRRAWKALSANVNFAGRLGYVQQVAGSPFPFYENQSHVYASGAFLMFGAEVLKLQ
jgi:rhamnogalacturonyl hydrolase YesR